MGLIDTVAIRKGYPIMMTDREEHIKNLSYIMDSMPDDACGYWRDSLAYAIETMYKYQKITEIMSELNGDFYGSYLKDRQTLEKIYEVVEDGNVD